MGISGKSYRRTIGQCADTYVRNEGKPIKLQIHFEIPNLGLRLMLLKRSLSSGRCAVIARVYQARQLSLLEIDLRVAFNGWESIR